MSALHGTGCVALVEVVGASALHARVPAAFSRGKLLLDAAVTRMASDTGGAAVASAARGQLLRFERPDEAVAFAMALQVELLGLDWPATLLVRPESAEERGPDGGLLFRGLRVRIAIHQGRLSEAPQGGVDGPAVYQVARVAAVAHGGQVLLTGAAADLLDPEREPGGGNHPSVVLRDLGAHSLAAVEGELRLFQVLPASLDERRFPDVETQRVRRSNVPASDEPVYGRQGDLAALSELLHLGVRAVVVSGPAGVGKSLLVRQFAAARAADGRFAGGVWFCRVDEETVGALCRATAWALRVPLDERASVAAAVDQLGHALAARGPLLLVIDAVDRPVPEVRAALDKWLRIAPKLCLMVNSRGPLRVSGEVEYRVRPLQIPTLQNPQRGEGPRVYAARARGIDEDFTVDDPSLLSELVAAIGGRPLPIRLLAGFVDRLPPDEQLQRVRSGTLNPEVVGGPGGLLEPLIELLEADEFQVLVACSALPGSFDVRSLAEVGQDGSPATSALRIVDRLERRGLVRDHADPSAVGIHRYTVEPAVVSLVLDRLPEVERRSLRERRATQLVNACHRLAAVADLADRPEIVARIAADWDGLVEAVKIGLDPTREDSEPVELALRACLVLRPVLLAKGPLFVGLELLDAVLRRSDAILGTDPLLQLRVLLMRAELLRAAGRIPQCLADLDRAGAIAHRWSDRQAMLRVLIEQGNARVTSGGSADVAALEAAVSAVDEGFEPASVATARAVLGWLHLAVGRFPEAEATLRQAIDELRSLGMVVEQARALTWLALLQRRFGRYEQACELYGEAIGYLRALGGMGRESQVRADLGLVDVHLGRYAEAEEALTEAVALARWSGDRRGEAHALRYLGLLDVIRGNLDRSRQVLVEAMAIDRDRGDPTAEGIVTGLLGVAHHLGDQRDAARESYRRACHLLEGCGERRMLALFGAWSAALEAEHGDHGTARALFETARLRQEELSDPQVGAALHQLRGVIELMEATLAEAAGDLDSAARWREAARARWAEAEARRSPLPVEARLAHSRVGRRLRGD
jgi:tetratricopeptide (TPR) repeat protein